MVMLDNVVKVLYKLNTNHKKNEAIQRIANLVNKL